MYYVFSCLPSHVHIDIINILNMILQVELTLEGLWFHLSSFNVSSLWCQVNRHVKRSLTVLQYISHEGWQSSSMWVFLTGARNG